jgi:phosphate:Na+ symporter
MMIGGDIGTTLTAILATVGANRPAKQAAAAHVLFNVIGAAVVLFFLSSYKAFIVATSSDIARQLANSHTIFNIINTLLLSSFIYLNF